MTPAEHTPDRLGPYRLLDRIGEGGMGVVYLARDPEQRSVAVKILRPAVAGDPNARRRLAREVETMRRVRSPFVAEVLDTDVTSETPYIVTRYVPGRTLDEVVTQEGPLSGARLIRVAAGLADALAAIHAAGVVHRDLKPGNVMLMNGDPVVIDFGIAQALDSTRLTMTGMFMGTPGYLSPEVIEGQNSTSFSDVHAWGATVAFAATGRPPFGTGSYETIFYRIVNGKPDLSGVPAPMAELLAAALRRDPAQRPAAIQLRSRAAALDPAVLLPLAVPAGGLQGTGAGAAPGTRADRPAAAPHRAGRVRRGPGRDHGLRGRPGRHHVPAAGRGDGPARDPADRRQAGPRRRLRGHPSPGDLPAGQRDGRRGGYRRPGRRQFRPPRGRRSAPGAPGRAAAPGDGRGTARTAGRRPRRQPILVLATMVIAVSLAVLLPVAGTLIALAVLVLLRAGDLAHRGSDQRGAIMSAAAYPFFVAPLAGLHRGPGAAGADRGRGRGRAHVPGHAGPARRLHALSYGAGALVAFYALRPGVGQGTPPAQPGLGARWCAARACRRWRCSGCARSRSPRSPPR